MGVLFEGGLIERWFNEVVKCFQPKVFLFMLFNDEISPLLLIISIFIVVKLKLSYFKINQLFNKQKQ